MNKLINKMMRKPHAGTEWQDFQEHIYVGRGGFPFAGFALLTIGVLWLLQSIHIIQVEIPWWPIILILVAFWIIAGRVFR